MHAVYASSSTVSCTVDLRSIRWRFVAVNREMLIGVPVLCVGVRFYGLVCDLLGLLGLHSLHLPLAAALGSLGTRLGV